MDFLFSNTCTSIPDNRTSHPSNPIPDEPTHNHAVNAALDTGGSVSSSRSTRTSSLSDPECPSTPRTDAVSEQVFDELKEHNTLTIDPTIGTTPRRRRASTILLSSSPKDVRRILGAESGTDLIQKVCCGGGCCFLNSSDYDEAPVDYTAITVPDNDAFRSLSLKLGSLTFDTKLTSTVDLPEQIVSLESLPNQSPSFESTVDQHPPKFVTPHPPYEVFSAKVHHARELTKPGAEKKTYHFDLDVTDYPTESGEVDFIVGGAIGVCAPNSRALVDEVFDMLGIPGFIRDKHVTLVTTGGRWPTIWGDEEPRNLATTRRELLTWCSDLQSYAPTKPLMRLLGEYAEAPNEKQILLYLSSAQGQAAFCDLRTGPHITICQLLNAFPSSKPPLPHLLSTLQTLMPRFYSLSQDPQTSCTREGVNCRRVIEMAVTLHETPDWRGGVRSGVGSGFLERTAKRVHDAENNGTAIETLDIRVPMFRGLMANPLAREFASDGPMLLIGAGVGVAPFRGFVQRRLKSASCANKVWVLQGIRDSLLDELYNGEWGVEEDKVKKVVQSRRGEGRYVQEEVRNQADLVWLIINALDGRVFVCGSTKGMGEGVKRALIDVAMGKGNLNLDEAEAFWKQKQDGGQYVEELW